MEWFEKRALQQLAQRKSAGLLRSSRVFRPLEPGVVEVDGRRLVNFGSNDYLGLAWHPKIRDVRTNAWGSGASPLVTGRGEFHATLELQIANWKQAAAALSFTSGYATNVSVVPALAIAGDIVFSDQLNHASIIDGCRLASAQTIVFPHNDMDALRKLVAENFAVRQPGQGFWIVTDSVFSMEGDTANLAAIASLAREFQCCVIIDEAHAVGVYGTGGSGMAEQSHFDGCELVSIGTCSKSLGSIGGYVAGSQHAIELVRQFGRGYIYSTALPADVVAATSRSIDICQSMDQQREELRGTAIRFRASIAQRGFQTSGHDSPICPIYLSEPEIAVAMSSELAEQGFFVPAIRPPTVPVGKSLLRVSLSVSHSSSQIDAFFEALDKTTCSLSK